MRAMICSASRRKYRRRRSRRRPKSRRKNKMATGSLYPGSLDSIADHASGDFLTVAQVNLLGSAIEKLESGPLRPNDGSAAAPAYAFRTSATAGFFLSAANQIDVSTGSTARWRWNSSGHFVGVADNTYDIGATGATRPRSVFVGTNVTVGNLLLMNTATTTGSSVGDIILNNTKSIRWITADGTTTTNS